jgi:hypothetical protein
MSLSPSNSMWYRKHRHVGEHSLALLNVLDSPNIYGQTGRIELREDGLVKEFRVKCDSQEIKHRMDVDMSCLRDNLHMHRKLDLGVGE